MTLKRQAAAVAVGGKLELAVTVTVGAAVVGAAVVGAAVVGAAVVGAAVVGAAVVGAAVVGVAVGEGEFMGVPLPTHWMETYP